MTSQSSYILGTQPRGSLQILCIFPCSQHQEVKVIEEATAASDKQSHGIFSFSLSIKLNPGDCTSSKLCVFTCLRPHPCPEEAPCCSSHQSSEVWVLHTARWASSEGAQRGWQRQWRHQREPRRVPSAPRHPVQCQRLWQCGIIWSGIFFRMISAAPYSAWSLVCGLCKFNRLCWSRR